jgi:hypothetical protein
LENVILGKLSENCINTIRVLSTQSKVKAIVLVGSINISDEFNDYDLLVLYEGSTIQDSVMKLFSDKKLVKCDDSIRIIFYKEKEINLALYNVVDFKNKVTNIFKENQPIGEHREWALGYWLPEVLVQDILNSYVLYDSSSGFNELFNYVNTNKNSFKQMMISRCTEEVKLKSMYIETNNNILETLLLRNDLILAFMRIISLTNFRNLSGFKKFKINMERKSKEEIYKLLESYAILTEKESIIQYTRRLQNLIFGEEIYELR